MAHAGGRPLKFKTLEELQEKIDAYFATTPDDELTITGLALALDTSRVTLCDYEERFEFSNAIKTAKERVENSYERALRRNGRAGEIFALKNFGWHDTPTVDQSQHLHVEMSDKNIRIDRIKEKLRITNE